MLRAERRGIPLGSAAAREVADDRPLPAARAGALPRLRHRPDHPGRPFQPVQVERARSAGRLHRAQELPGGPRERRVLAGGGQQHADHRPVPGSSRSRSRSGSRVLLNRRFPGRAIFRLLFFVPYVLSEAITGIVFSLLLQPDALVDSTLKTRRSGGAHPGLARQHRHRDAHPLRDHLVEVLRLPHDPAAGRAPGHPAGRSRRPP